MSKKGFTLIELLVVISIIGLLASIILVSLNSARAKARYAKTLSDMRSIKLAAEFYYDDYNIYPYDRPPEAITVSWDPTSGFLVPDDLPNWPKPPCTGWKYDWDDWIRDTPHNVANALISNGNPDQIVRVTLLDATGARRYYYCIFDANPSAGSPCKETETTLDIITVADKKLDCS